MDTISKRQIEQIATKGRYFEADEAVTHNRDVKEAQSLARRKALEEEQALEWQAFENAKARFIADMSIATTAAQEAKWESLRSKQVDDTLAHEEELEAFAIREETVITRRPVALSAHVIDLKREERQLSVQGRFMEAAAVQDMASRREMQEQRAAAAAKRRAISEKVRGKEESIRAKERASVANMRFKMHLERIKAERGLSCLYAALQHMETDMAAAHERQRRQLQRLGYVPQDSKAQQCKAARGTLLERQVLGDPYALPSMCVMYGALFDGDARLYSS